MSTITYCMPKIGDRATDGTGKTFCGWALFCAYENFTHDPWPTYAEARAHVEFTDKYGMCPQEEPHEVVEVWKQGRAGVELGGHYPSEVEIADLVAYAIENGLIDP